MPFLTGSGVEDSRPPGLKRLRRSTKQLICREAGLEFDESRATSTDLDIIITSNQIDISPYLKQQHILGQKEAPAQAIQRVEKEKEALEERLSDLENKFMQMFDAKESAGKETAENEAIAAGELPNSFSAEDKTPIWRLRQYAKIAGIEFVKTDKAVDIIGKLNEYTTARRQ